MWFYAVGRIVPGTSRCRACRFDLKGLSAAPACPECGKSLATPGAIIPLRIRSRGRLWLGILLLIISFGAAATFGGLALSKANIATIKPAWLLKVEALHGTPSQSAEALTEITRRIRADTTFADTWTRLVGDAMARRRNLAKPWNRGWSDFLELARAHGKVPDADWIDYVRYSTVALSQSRKVIRQGSKAPFGATLSGTQLGTAPASLARAVVGYSLERIVVGDVVVYQKHGSGHTTATISSSGMSGTTTYPTIDAPIGKHSFVITWRFEVMDPASESVALGNYQIDFTQDIEVVSSDTPTIESRPTSAPRDAVTRSLVWRPIQKPATGYVDLMIDARGVPANLAFEVFARLRNGKDAGKLVRMGQASFSQGSQGGYGLGVENSELSDATAVDLVLRPSIEAAEMNPSLDWIWTGDEIIYENVAIETRK